ncbi:MAG: hypothetical protein Q4G06_05445 [Clostridia bacterium]|nr:hypothetical protein [Clostridia bacterium]
MSENLNRGGIRAVLGAASLSGALSTGSVIVNDYTITMQGIDGGHRLTITRGSDVQTMDLMDGAQGEPGKDAPQDVVCYTAQSLDPDQQAQARKNIAAAGVEDLSALNDTVSKFPVIKSGVISILFPTGSKSVSQDIVFDEKMVDTNYAIVLNADGGNGNYRFFTQYTNKLQSGFRAYLISDNNTALSADRTVEVSWLAIR